jgi:phosphoserine aminotransferase
MNVAFRLVDEAQLPAFHAAAARAGFSGLSGHRSLGGLRASLYNAVEPQAAHHLAEFLATGWHE